MIAVLRAAPGSSAPGPDRIPYLAYKAGAVGAHADAPPPIVAELAALFSQVILEGRIPGSWNQSETILLPKSPGACDVSEMRPITLSQSRGKLFTAVLARRLQRGITLLRGEGAFSSL